MHTPSLTSLALLLALAPVALAQERPPYRLPGTIQLDGRPWPGGRVTLVLLDDQRWVPAGPTVELVGDAQGAFVATLVAGPWRIAGHASWPKGASIGCDLGDEPHAPGHETLWVGYANTCRASIHGRDDTITIDVLSPVPLCGRVVEAGGEPATGAQIALVARSVREADEEPLPQLETTAGPDGRFELRAPAWLAGCPHDAALAARAFSGAEVAFASLGLQHRDDRVAPPEDVTLVLRPTLACAGRVEALDGSPIEGARISIETTVPDARDPDDRFGLGVIFHPEQDGPGFRFEVLPGSGWWAGGPHASRVELSVRAPGFVKLYEQLYVCGGSGDGRAPAPVLDPWPHCAPAVGGRDRPPVVVRLLRDEQPLSGQVVDARGAPLPGAHVDAGGVEVTTDAAGRFEVEAPEVCELRIVADGHAGYSARVRLPARDLEVRLAPSAPIAGRLVDRSGRPVGGVTIGVSLPLWIETDPAIPGAPGDRAEWSPGVTFCGRKIGEVVTAPDGRFTFPGGWPGTPVCLRVGEQPLAANLQPGTDVNLELAYVGSDSVCRDPRTCIRVRAQDEAGAELEAARWRVSTTTSAGVHSSAEATGSDVTFALDVASASLWVSAPGHAEQHVEAGALPPQGGTLDLGTVRLARAGRVALRVRWPEDRPVNGLEVHWTDADGEHVAWHGAPRVETDEPARIDGVAPGEVVLSVFTTGPEGGDPRPCGSIRVTVREGEETHAELDLRGR